MRDHIFTPGGFLFGVILLIVIYSIVEKALNHRERMFQLRKKNNE